jgi:acyl-CoA thioester hydrolase
MPSLLLMKAKSSLAIHRHAITISKAVIDANGHTNNVEYLRWMQDAAISHADATGCTAATKAAGASWVVRSHHIEYLQPTFPGDRIIVLTWVSTFRKASSLRKYLFIREPERAVIARGETNWVFVDAQTGRPKPIPTEVFLLFTLVPASLEPRDGNAM